VSRKFEITVLGENNSGNMILMDRCTMTAGNTADAARQYARLFSENEPDHTALCRSRITGESANRCDCRTGEAVAAAADTRERELNSIAVQRFGKQLIMLDDAEMEEVLRERNRQ
jgi:hypothetical protein